MVGKMRKLVQVNRLFFNKYDVTILQKLSRKAFEIYKTIRIWYSKWKPLNEAQRFAFEKDSHNEKSTKMPLGYDFSTYQRVEGFVNLKYIDFYDFLPKESLDAFRKSLKNFVSKNKRMPYGDAHDIFETEFIDEMGTYSDYHSYRRICDIRIINNTFLESYAEDVTVSSCNLSTSFCIIKYRFHIKDEFNKKYNNICQHSYDTFTDVFRPLNVPWYKPWKFGRSYSSGNREREKQIYFLMAELKKNICGELEKYFHLSFINQRMFLPVFETYKTNLLLSEYESNVDFWDSLGFGRRCDYSNDYNLFLPWPIDANKYQGNSMVAVCGGETDNNDYIKEIAMHDISDDFSVYLVADTINKLANRDIAVCNKRISKGIRSARASKLLKIRLKVKKQIYQTYRFLSEFTGNTIAFDSREAFVSDVFDDGTLYGRIYDGLSNKIRNTKEQVDILLNLMDDATEYTAAKSDRTIQFIMIIVTVLSLIVAILSLTITAEGVLKKGIIDIVLDFLK